MRKLYRVSILLVVMLTIAACGTVATPRYEAEQIIAEAEEEATRIVAAAQNEADGVEVAVVSTEATEEVTPEVTAEATVEITPEVTVEVTAEATEVEVTEAATVEATEEVTAEATVVEATVEVIEVEVTAVEVTEVTIETEATTEATEAEAHDDHGGEAASGETSELEAEIMAAVEAADATAGESKFLATGCTGCHMTTDMQLVGPGLQGLFDRAGGHADHRPEDQGPYEYIFTSIRNSQAFVVEGFAPGLMPVYTEAQLSDEDIYNIMAYLHQFSSEE
jgi:mono/diheme cytochrome c family protein